MVEAIFDRPLATPEPPGAGVGVLAVESFGADVLAFTRFETVKVSSAGDTLAVMANPPTDGGGRVWPRRVAQGSAGIGAIVVTSQTSAPVDLAFCVVDESGALMNPSCAELTSGAGASAWLATNDEGFAVLRQLDAATVAMLRFDAAGNAVGVQPVAMGPDVLVDDVFWDGDSWRVVAEGRRPGGCRTARMIDWPAATGPDLLPDGVAVIRSSVAPRHDAGGLILTKAECATAPECTREGAPGLFVTVTDASGVVSASRVAVPSPNSPIAAWNGQAYVVLDASIVPTLYLLSPEGELLGASGELPLVGESPGYDALGEMSLAPAGTDAVWIGYGVIDGVGGRYEHRVARVSFQTE